MDELPDLAQLNFLEKSVKESIKGVEVQWHYLQPMTSNDYSTDYISLANAGVQNGTPLLGPGFSPVDATPLVVLQVLVWKWKYLMLKA
jgi:hypothetical protein